MDDVANFEVIPTIFVGAGRIAVGSSDERTISTCLLCGSSFDDYSSRCRCAYCRMLVLVCDSCRVQANYPFHD